MGLERVPIEDWFLKEEKFIDIRIKVESRDAFDVVDLLMESLNKGVELAPKMKVEKIYFSAKDPEDIMNELKEKWKNDIDNLKLD